MTRRKEIIALLSSGEWTARQLANQFQVELYEILVDLKHVEKSKKLKKEPAQCENCGFVYRERSKLKKPSKCPKCKSERILPPRFFI